MALDCSICCEPWDAAHRTPLVLKCGHTFCKACITRGSYHGVVKCYHCSAVDGRPLQSLPKNFALLDLTEQQSPAVTPLDKQLAAFGLQEPRFLINPEELQLSSVVLGSGATGRVVRGRLGATDVAVKVVELCDVPAHTQQALQRETAIALQLAGQCHHCCQYRGACIKDDMFCLVMRLYDGNLMKTIAEAGAGGLPLPALLRYGAQAAAALGELHRLGVLVLDLKPQNLLLDSALDEVVVADFGLGQVMSHTIGGYRPTNPSLAGTLNYMAPEQFAADSDDCDEDEPTAGEASGSSPRPQLLTPAADVWAWACTVLHGATGHIPHAGLKLPQITLKVGMRRRGPLVPHDLPGPLRELLLRCLAAEPQQRPTAHEVLQEMQSMQVLLGGQMRGLSSTSSIHSSQQDLRVLYVPTHAGTASGASVLSFSVPFSPAEMFGSLIQHLAKQVGETPDSLPAHCIDFGQQLGPQHFKLTLQELGWQPGCLVALGELTDYELHMCQHPDSAHESDGLTQLHHWVCHCDLRKVQLLLAAGADPNYRNDQHYTSLLKKAVHCHMGIAHFLLDSYGTKLLPNVLVQGIEEVIQFKAWPLLDRITRLLESHPERQAYQGELHAVLESEQAMQLFPQLLRRLGAAGVEWQLSPQLLSGASEPTLRLALQLDPSCLSRTSWLNDQSHKRQSWQGWSALHEVCGLRWPWTGLAPLDRLEQVQLFIAAADTVDPIHEKVGVLDFDRKWCEFAMGHDGCEGINYKFHATRHTPLHMVVCLAMDFASRHAGGYCVPVSEDRPWFEGPDESMKGSFVWQGFRACSYEARVQLAAEWLPVAQMLVAAGADVKKSDRWNRTPYSMLMSAVSGATRAAAGQPDKGQALQQVLKQWAKLFMNALKAQQNAADTDTSRRDQSRAAGSL